MVKNNLQIKVGNAFVDYDDETAIGITFRAFDVSNIDTIFLNASNSFSVPATANNRKIFDFADNAFSNAIVPYTKMECKLYSNGALFTQGTLYISDIVDGRYNINFVENKDVFDILNNLPFTSFKSQGDSICKRVCDRWNTEVLQDVINKYMVLPDDSSEMLRAIVSYTNELEDVPGKTYKAAKNDICIPFYQNAFAYSNVKWKQNLDGVLERVENNIFTKGTLDEEQVAKGYILGSKLSTAIYDLSTWPTDAFRKENGVLYNGQNLNEGNVLVSPFWARLAYVVDIMEEATGWKFENLKELIDRKDFINVVGMEFDWDYGYFDQTEPNFTIKFKGNTTMVDNAIATNNLYDRSNLYNDGTVEPVGNASLGEKTVLDLLKSIMQEYNLVFDIFPTEKKLTFYHFSQLKDREARRIKLISEDDRSFAYSGIKRIQSISYKENKTEDKVGRVIYCSNQNIEMGNEDDKLIEIDRCIFGNSDYKWAMTGRNQRVSLNVPDLRENEIKKEFLIATPAYSNSIFGSLGTSEISHICLSQCLYDYETYTLGGEERVIVRDANVDALPYTTTKPNLLNTLIQNTVKNRDAYDYYQSVLYYPLILDITVKSDENFLNSFDKVTPIKIDGMPGIYYVKEITEYNPRTDDTMKLKVIKLFEDSNEDEYTLDLYVNDIAMGKTSGEGTYFSGQYAKIEALPNKTFYFSQWSDGNEMAIRNVFVNENKEYTANFKKVPTGYTEIPYIQSNGTAYIDTGVNGGNCRIKCKVQADTGANVYGTDFSIGLYGNRIHYVDDSNVVISKSIDASTYTTIDHNANIANVDGAVITIGSSEVRLFDGKSLYLFGTNGEEQPTGKRVRFTGDIEVYNSFGTLARLYTPVRRDYDGEIGLYDRVTNKFVGSANEAKFVTSRVAMQYTLSLGVSPEGAGTTSGQGTYTEGTSVIARANANEGWYFKNWNDGVTTSQRTVIIDGNKNYIANFTNAPAGFKRVEYIGRLDRQNNSARINLGFSPNSDTVTFLDYYLTSQPVFTFYGYFAGNDQTDYRFFLNYLDIFGSRLSGFGSLLVGKHKIEIGNNYIKENDYIVASGEKQNVVTAMDMTVFGSQGYTACGGAVYEIEVGHYDANSQFVREHLFVPMVREADDMGGLFDMVTGQFRAADGKIAYGPEI